MPSHLRNWMKDGRKSIEARNKALVNYMKLGAFTGTVNYQLVKGNVMEDVFRKDAQNHTIPLNESVVKSVIALKEKAEELYVLMDSYQATREMALAKTNLEQAVMWAVKSITK